MVVLLLLLLYILCLCHPLFFFFFFFNDTATTEIYTLSLHDALPISIEGAVEEQHRRLDFVRIARRGAGAHLRPLADEFALQPVVAPVAPLLLGFLEVGDGRDRDHGLENRGVGDRRLQRRVTAIRPADDPELACWRDSLRDEPAPGDRKSTRLNSSHSQISY